MSSWARTSKAQQRIHKERCQPEERQKLGFLEKKKDYKLRAVDHERKQNTLKTLRQKALDRNPDEFYFHMVNSKVEKGKHVEKPKEEEATKEQKKLIKNQDLRYVRLKRTAELKKIQRLKASLAGTFVNRGLNRHLLFTDDDEDNLAEKEGTTLTSSLATSPPKIPIESEKVLLRERKKSLKELAQRLKREKELRITEQKLEVHRNLLTAKKAKKISDGSKSAPACYKWTFHRKR